MFRIHNIGFHFVAQTMTTMPSRYCGRDLPLIDFSVFMILYEWVRSSVRYAPTTNRIQYTYTHPSWFNIWKMRCLTVGRWNMIRFSILCLSCAWMQLPKWLMNHNHTHRIPYQVILYGKCVAQESTGQNELEYEHVWLTPSLFRCSGNDIFLCTPLICRA